MDYTLLYVIYIFAFPIIFLVAKLFVTFFHELGHAVAALLFNYKDVEIYVGTNKDNDNYVIDLIDLKINFPKNLLKIKWNGSTYFSKKNENHYKSLVINMSGVIGSSLMSFYCIYKFFNSDSNFLILIILFLVGILSILSIYINLKPITFLNYDYNYIKNDGLNIKLNLFFIINNKQIAKIESLENNKNYKEAIQLLEELKLKNFHPEYMVANRLNLYSLIGNQDKVKLQLEKFATFIHLPQNTINNLILISFGLEHYDLTIKFCEKIFKIDPFDIKSNFYCGFAYFQKENFEIALKYFDKLIDIDDENTKRTIDYFKTFIKYKLGAGNEELLALKSIDCVSVKDFSPLFILGKYFLDIKDYSTALDYFQKVKEFEPKYFTINNYIELTENLNQEKTNNVMSLRINNQ